MTGSVATSHNTPLLRVASESKEFNHPTPTSLPLSLPPAARQVKYLSIDNDTEKGHYNESTVADASDVEEQSPHHSSGPPNVARLIPMCDFIKSSPMRIECVYRGPGPFQLVLPEGTGIDRNAKATPATLDTILQHYKGQITSMVFDASSLSNPVDTVEMALPVVLPLTLGTTPHGDHADDLPSPAFVLPELIELEVHTSRRLSLRSLLQFLQCTPMLRTLSIHTTTLHYSVWPETGEDLPKVSLPCVQQVDIRGLFAGTVDDILSNLVTNAGTRVSVHLKPGFPSQHLSTLRTTLSTVRHACLSYTALEWGSDSGRSDRYLFTFSDIDARVQVHWDWEMASGDPASLFHITLDPGAVLTGVHTLTVSLRDVAPSFSDWYTILKPFPSLRHLDLHTTPRPGATDAVACGCRTATFRVRSAALLKKIANVPLMFALGLAEYCHPSGAFPGGVPMILGPWKGLYSLTWRRMVHKSTG